MLPALARSIAMTVAEAASSTCRNDHHPAPSPINGTIGHFINDDVRLGGSHGSANSRRIEAVDHDGFRAHSFDRLRLRWRTRMSDNRVTCRDQCGNKRTAHSAGGACNKDSDAEILIFVATARHLVPAMRDW